MSFEQRKVQEFRNMLRTKKDHELKSVKDNLVAKMKGEQRKQNPDPASIQNYRWQLSIIGNEMNERNPHPNPLERMSAEGMAKDQNDKSFEEQLKAKTLDELNKALNDLSRDMGSLTMPRGQGDTRPVYTPEKLTEMTESINTKIGEVRAEIASRSVEASKEAKKDIAKAEDKWLGVDRDMIFMGGAIGLMGGAVGYAMGRKGWEIAGFALLGIGVGTGIVYLSKREKPIKTAPNL